MGKKAAYEEKYLPQKIGVNYCYFSFNNLTQFKVIKSLKRDVLLREKKSEKIY